MHIAQPLLCYNACLTSRHVHPRGSYIPSVQYHGAHDWLPGAEGIIPTVHHTVRAPRIPASQPQQIGLLRRRPSARGEAMIIL